jgi:hypothetical protein
MAGKTKHVGREAAVGLPNYLVEHQESRAATLDLDSLKRKLVELAQTVARIDVPSQEAWEGMLVERSLNLHTRDERLYWAYHAYFGSERFRRDVDAYNGDVDSSGLLELARGTTPREGSAVSFVLRAVATGQPSSALLDSWFHLGTLIGRQLELLGTHGDQRRLYQINLKSGAPLASIGQHVWYARWLVKNCRDFKNDRATAEYELTGVCTDIVHQRRVLCGPNGARPFGSVGGLRSF